MLSRPPKVKETSIHSHPAYASLARPGLEASERLAEEVVSLPLYPELADDEAQAVVEAALS